MKDNPTRKGAFRVSFSYVQTNTEKHGIEQHCTFQTPPACYVELGGKKQRSSPPKITQKCENTIINHSGEEQTLKKQSWGFEATTTRKQFSNIMIKNKQQEADISTIKQRTPCRKDSSSEVAILNEEIRYMRNRLIEVENAQKELRLEFELYKANQELSLKSDTQSGESIELQEDAYQSEISELKLKLKHQLTKAAELQQRILQQQSQKESALGINHQLNQIIKANTEQIELIRLNLLRYSEIQLMTLKANKQKEQNFTGQIQKMWQQNQRLNSLFQTEKHAKLFLQDQLKNKMKENESLLFRVDQMSRELQNRLKDIDFLNQQSYHLDMTLTNANQEISYLKSLLAQNGLENEGRLQLIAAKQKARLLEIKVCEIESQAQKKSVIINDLKQHYSNLIKIQHQQVSLIGQLKQKNEELGRQTINLQQQKQNDTRHINEIQDELILVKIQNEQLKISNEKLEENLRIISKEVEWLIKERDMTITALEQEQKQQINAYLQTIEETKHHKACIQLSYSQELACKNEKIAQLTAKCQQLNKYCEHNLTNTSQSINGNQPQPQEDQNNNQENSIGKTLTQSQLKTHLMQIRHQTTTNEQQNNKLREMLYIAKEELELTKQAHHHQIQHLTLKYQNQLKSSNQQHNAQINLYIEEIEKLMQEMDKLKVTPRYYSNEVIQQKPQEENEGQQTENTTNRSANQSDGEGNYLLQDIIDLDQKIHTYITNFSKRGHHSTQLQ